MVCGRTFHSVADLKTRTWTHADILPHRYDMCKAGFAKKQHVDARYHSTAQVRRVQGWVRQGTARGRTLPFYRTGATCARLGSPRDSTLMHTAILPHRCDVCKAGFAKGQHVDARCHSTAQVRRVQGWVRQETELHVHPYWFTGFCLYHVLLHSSAMDP